jgi:hypothetical protein
MVYERTVESWLGSLLMVYERVVESWPGSLLMDYEIVVESWLGSLLMVYKSSRIMVRLTTNGLEENISISASW